MARQTTCSGETLPAVQLAFDKKSCIRSNGEQLRSPAAIAGFINRIYGCKPQEVFIAIHFNVRNVPLAVHEVGMGGVTETAVDPKVVFGGALTSGAAAIVVVHNHPSGDATPSQMDVELTTQLVAGARLLGLQILDHIVVGRGGSYTSFLEQGVRPFGDERIRYPR